MEQTRLEGRSGMEGGLEHPSGGFDSGHAQLLVIDATDISAGPVARVMLPLRVPYGFHGTWVPRAAS